MKKSVKKFFLLGLAIGAVGYAATHSRKIKLAVRDLVKKKKLSKTEGESLTTELFEEIDKIKFKKPFKPKVVKKAKKPAQAKPKKSVERTVKAKKTAKPTKKASAKKVAKPTKVIKSKVKKAKK